MFWLVACDVADRIATSPSPPSVLAIMLHVVGADQVVMRRVHLHWRPSGAMPESKDSTVMPRSIAFLVVGTRALASLAEMISASTFWAISVSRIGDLLLDGGGGRPGVDQLDIAELVGRCLAAVTRHVEIVDAHAP